MIAKEKLLVYLKSGAKSYKCGAYLHRLPSIVLQGIYQDLASERMERKYDEIVALHGELDKEWNKVLLVMIFRVFADGDPKNKQAYMRLAKMFDYRLLQRERESRENLEAMLLVASGVYHRLNMDSYSKHVVKNGHHLLTNKYAMQGALLRPTDWSFRNIKGGNEPVLRLSQLAQLLHRHEMLYNKVRSIRSRDEVLDLFNLEASAEWSRYYGSDAKLYGVGIDKRDMIGINLVVPMLYAIGHYFDDQELQDAARDLSEAMPAESNAIIAGWRKYGLVPHSAYATQALLQLRNCYCLGKNEGGQTASDSTPSSVSGMARCESCPLFAHMVGPSSILDQVPILMEL